MKLTLLIGFFSILSLSSKADDLDILYNRLYSEITAVPPPTPATIQDELNLLADNGSFIDIDYTDLNTNPNWKAESHFTRLLDMALAYKISVIGNTNFGNTILKDKIKLGLLYWYGLTPQPFPNFYAAEIHNINQLRKLLLIMKYEYTEQDYKDVITTGCKMFLVLPSDYLTKKYKSANANCQFYSEKLIFHGIIEKDTAVLQEGINNMIGTIKIRNIGNEGLQVDGSYLVHGLQLYNCGYGLAMTAGISYWIEKTSGLSKQYFTQAQFNLVRTQLLNGDQWMIYGDRFDFSVCGRQFLTSAYRSGAEAVKTACARMKVADPGNSTEYQAFYNHINSGNGSVNSISGVKHFYRCDYTAYRRQGKFIGIKTCSSRTKGTESIGDNLKGFWMPFGATCIYTSANEYKEIFGYWDWTKIPGVTNPAVEFTWKGNNESQTQPATFVGGVTNGVYGASVMDFVKDSLKYGVKVDIQAKKSWFMFDDEMVALGVGISSSYAAAVTTTTLNQSKKNGVVSVNGSVVEAANDKRYSKVKMIYHDNTGYVFRTPADVYLKTNSQSGNWNHASKSRANETVSGDVFKLWIDHGTAPTNAMYEYIVLPNKTVAEVAAYSNNMPISIINTKEIQAVTHKELKITEAIFYVVGTLAIDKGPTISVDSPCAVLIDRSVNPMKVTVSDPNQSIASLTVSIDYGKNKREKMVFLMPIKESNMGGSSVTKTTMYTVL